MVIRTHRSIFRSRPGRILAIATLLVSGGAVILPHTALGRVFGLVPLPWTFVLTLAVITLLYLLASELLKRVMFARLGRGASPVR